MNTYVESKQEIHAERCKEQGHEWENCMTVFFQIYQQCKWCDKKSEVGSND